MGFLRKKLTKEMRQQIRDRADKEGKSMVRITVSKNSGKRWVPRPQMFSRRRLPGSQSAEVWWERYAEIRPLP